MTTNEDLRAMYDAGYAAGNTWHTPVDTWEESLLIHKMGGDWRGKSVLEIGCGEGRLAALIAANGARGVLGIDYSESAIGTAKYAYRLPNLVFLCGTHNDAPSMVDAVLMQGVLEHLDDWKWMLSEVVETLLNPGGHIITSSPSFLNPRGYVWQTLRLLFGVPMSLSDLHAINPWDMQEWCEQHGLPLTYESCHHDWAHGGMMQTDYEHRLPKALADAGLPTTGVDDLLDWLVRAGTYYQPEKWSGATVVYKIGPKP